MTTLAITIQERALEAPLVRSAVAASRRFADVNRKGWATILAACVLVGAAGAYLGAIYWIMGAGFSLQERQEVRREKEEEILRLEIALRAEETALFQGSHPMLKAMEKVSHISFVGVERENVAQAPESSLRP